MCKLARLEGLKGLIVVNSKTYASQPDGPKGPADIYIYIYVWNYIDI